MKQSPAEFRAAAVSGASAEPPQEALYTKHKKVYPRQVHGLFARLRTVGVLLLLGLYYGVAWLPWEGRQALLFDLPNRKFYILDWVFWPQDFFYLALLLIIAALSLFFFTALAGRLWCGYACPQTVWTEVFLWMERRIEGGRAQQMKLDRRALDARKLRFKATKHAAWILFALWTGFTFVGYFTPIRELWGAVWALELGPWQTFWILFYALATYGNAGWMREQVCIYMCPYARFQSALFDRDTLVISYDGRRGEPRGARSKAADLRAKGLGDCVDCTLCVQVCPTGIDIRDGLQYQCIGCAACVDVCDQVMAKMDYPKGLIRYTTENAMEGRPSRLLRPRVIVYGLLLILAMGGLAYALALRVDMDIDIIRDRNALYRQAPAGQVENVYTLRVINMADETRTFRIGVEGLQGLELINRHGAITLPAGELTSIDVAVRIDPAHLPATSSEIRFALQTADGDRRLERTARFIGPALR